MSQSRTMIDVLRANVQRVGERPAYIFSNGDREVGRLSFGELEAVAQRVAAQLVSLGVRGERVLLMLPTGLPFLQAFFGCLYAGAVPVPVNVPRGGDRTRKIQRIQADCGARAVLITHEMFDEVLACELLAPSVLLETLLGEAAETTWRDPQASSEDIAFLQYTSGSTGEPKGVVVSHRNLLANQAMIEAGFGHDDATVFAGWLPLFHDMGLVGNVLHPAYLGVPSVLMPPVAFIQWPARWLRMVSDYSATTSGGPNFAFELCARRVSESDLSGVDLSSWRVAFNGAEPVRAATLQRFCDKFSPFGFRRHALYPCYGMAEATLFVSGGPAHEEPRLLAAESASLNGRVEPVEASPSASVLVSSGVVWMDERVLIVDPETRRTLSDLRVGEIWVSGSHIASGYWNAPAASAATFQARTVEGEGPFLRTGDLGFLRNGALFVTGRLKDLVIVAGRNHYPQDLEDTIQQGHEAFDGRPGAAFALTTEAGEELAIVQEINRKAVHTYPEAELEQFVRRLIVQEHGIVVKRLLLIKRGTLPMTTSGKVRRARCRELLLGGELVRAFEEDASAAQ